MNNARALPIHLHRGISLIEMLVVIALATIVMTTAAQLVQLVMRQQESASQEASTQRTVQRAARQFRQDVQAAQSALRTADPQQGATELTLTQPSGDVVHYRATGHRLVRTVRHGGEVVHRDPFDFADQVAVELPALPSPAVALRVTTASPVDRDRRQAQEAGRTLEIVAAVGRDRRFQRPAGGAKE